MSQEDGVPTNLNQAGLELEPEDAEDGINQSPRDMEIDTARLFEQATEQTRMALCVSDPHREDCPIVFVNQAFVELTGYPREEVVGRNCRFLQGPDTAPQAVERIRRAMREETVTVTELLNYKKDGTPFWNALHVGPIYDQAGHLTHYYGSQWDVTDLVEERERTALGERVAEELQHRTRNLFGVLNAIVRLSASGMTDAQALAEKIEGRIDALATAHNVSIAPGGHAGRPSDLHGLVEAILTPYRTGAAHRIEVQGPDVEVPKELVTPLGLALHELATNAVKYGALAAPDGTLRIEWRRKGGTVPLSWIETGRAPVPSEDEARTRGPGGTGTQIVDGVLTAAGGDIERDWRRDGLAATIRLPIGGETPGH